MDEKSDTRYRDNPNDDTHVYATRPQPQPTPPAVHGWALYYRDRTLQRLFTAACLTLVAWITVHSFLTRHKPTDINNDRWSSLSSLSSNTQTPCLHNNNATTKKVPLEAHIMSKCPDAKACLQDLVVPAMEKIHDKVDFKLSYIGSIDNTSDAVSCKHGPSECLGNMILLCAAELYPDPIISLGFANCLISDYDDIPDRALVEDCALEHGMDFAKVNACIGDDDGAAVELLRASVERSEEVGVRTSCTVRVAGKVRCVRDGGEWRDCGNGSSVGSLVGDLERIWDEWN